MECWSGSSWLWFQAKPDVGSAGQHAAMAEGFQSIAFEGARGSRTSMNAGPFMEMQDVNLLLACLLSLLHPKSVCCF